MRCDIYIHIYIYIYIVKFGLLYFNVINTPHPKG